MIEFLTQTLTMPVWGAIVVFVFALIGIFFLPIAIIAWRMRNEITQKGLAELDNKLEIVKAKESSTLHELEELKETERRLEKEKIGYEQAKKDCEDAETKLKAAIEENEKTKAELAEQQKATERANACRRGLLGALTSQRQTLEQEKKELALKRQKNALKAKSTTDKK